jgi:hypothetical protein
MRPVYAVPEQPAKPILTCTHTPIVLVRAEGLEPSNRRRSGVRNDSDQRNNLRCNSLVLPPFVPNCAHYVPGNRHPSRRIWYHPRHRRPGCLSSLLAGNAFLEALADQAAQLGVGIVDAPRRPPSRRPLRRRLAIGTAAIPDRFRTQAVRRRCGRLDLFTRRLLLQGVLGAIEVALVEQLRAPTQISVIAVVHFFTL